MNYDQSSVRNRHTSPRSLRLRLAAAGVAVLGTLGVAGSTLMRAEVPATRPVQQDAAVMARIDDLATAMRTVGRALEPSVVSIEIERRGNPNAMPQLDDETLRRFFDPDGDGQPNLPRGFRLPDRGNGNSNDGAEEDENATPRRRAPRVYGEGSGVIVDVDGRTGWIVTNNHVAGDAEKLTVTLHDGRRIENAEVVGVDPLTDLAVLKVEADDLQAAKWGKSESLEKGDIVLAFGSPFGYVGSMTQGIVSAMNRSGTGILGQNGYENFIQTDCAINPGNSGGPLVNVHGEIVGINTAIATRTGNFAGIGFAIPSQLAQHVYTQLKDDGHVTRGFLGVDIRDASAINTRQAERLGLKANQSGVFVIGFRNDTPADGKLQPNDVITSIDGQKVRNSTELRIKVATTPPGTNVKLGVIRDKEPTEVELTLGTLDLGGETRTARNDERQDRADADRNTVNIGATLNDPNTARLRSAGLPAGSKGALVTEVQPGSPAAESGMQPGDLITKVADKTVNNAADARNAIRSQDLAEGFDVLIKNREGTRSLFIQTDDE